MNKWLLVLIIIIAVIVVGSIFKDLIIRTAVSGGVQAVTGLKLEMRGLHVGLSSVGIKDLKLFNPAGYPDKIMVDMPEFYVSYDLLGFLSGKAHIKALKLNLSEFVIIKNQNGELNINSLKVVKAQKEAQAAPGKKKAKAPEINIDRLDLKIGKVVYKDYSRGTPPKVQEYNLKLDEHYENITDLYSLGSLIIVKALMSTGLASVTGFDLGPLSSSVSSITTTAFGTANQAVNVGTGVAETAAETAKETAETLKRILPFGK